MLDSVSHELHFNVKVTFKSPVYTKAKGTHQQSIFIIKILREVIQVEKKKDTR
jgi:hypothetical protein